MHNITVKKVAKNYGGRDVLANVSFSLALGQKLALVGANGSGKSTLLKILSNLEGVDAGDVSGLENACAYIAQDFSGDPNGTPADFLTERGVNLKKAMRLLSECAFDVGSNQNRLRTIRCEDLSGGEKKKLEIVAGLANGSLFLAIDEPENHLDFQTIEWLVDTLHGFQGGLIFVTHDQYLVDQLADSILELENGVVTSYSMSYHDYLKEKLAQKSGQAREWLVKKQTIERLTQTVTMMRLRAIKSSSTASTYQQARRRLEELKEGHGHKPEIETEKPKIVLADVDQKSGKRIAAIHDMSFSYGDHRIFQNATATLHFGEKVVLLGANGSGKSTLLKLLNGELSPSSGSATIAAGTKWLTLTQEHLAGINPDLSALDIFRATVPLQESLWRSLLVRYGINRDLARRPLRLLSGGQQARFKLALTFAQKPEFIILDEPTNHVDPPTWEAIVAAIQNYSGTVLAVTHDHAFIDAIAEKLWLIENRQLVVEHGNYSEYCSKEQYR